MIRLIVLSLAALLPVGALVAQPPMLPDLGDLDTPPEFELPMPEQELAESLAKGDFEPQAYDLWDYQPAAIESSGTWLERGFWYAETDVVVMNRTWNRDDMYIMADDPRVTSPDFGTIPGFTRVQSDRLVLIRGSQPGEDASVRLTLGRFLFRDRDNRDHSAEFTVFGGGDFVEQTVTSSQNANGLFVPFYLDGGNTSFSGATESSANYSHRYNSFEINYRVKPRMRKDQMVLDANGCWRRRARRGLSKDYLIGLRIFEMVDILEWRAEDIAPTNQDGQYDIRTDNDLFGVQVGAGLTYETSRWSLGFSSKGGAYVNDADSHEILNYTVDDAAEFNRLSSGDEMSFVGNMEFTGKWHLTPSFSLRGGWELMYVTSVALAPHQINFAPLNSQVATTGDVFYMGASLGFEGYW